MMYSGKVFVSAALLLLISVLRINADPTVDIQMDVTRAKEGDEVVIMCVVDDLGDNAITMTKEFAKVDDNPAIDNLIFLNKQLNNHIIFGNYKLVDTEIIGTTKVLYKVTISNVTARDSGPYSCKIQMIDVVKTKDFFVYTSVQEIMFQNATVDHSYGIRPVKEHEPFELDCTASGSIPAADLSIFIGDKDVTNDFRQTTEITRHCPAGITASGCMTYDTYNTNAYLPNYKPTYEDNHKDVRCVATVKGSDFEPMTAQIKMVVEFAPKFACDDVALAMLHEHGYKLKCIIKSNPGNPDFSWKFMWGGEEVSLSNNDKFGDDEFIAGQTPRDDGNMEVFLKIKQVSTRHWTSYTLFSGNSLGNTSMDIKLKEDDSANGAERPIAVGLAVCIVLIRALL